MELDGNISRRGSCLGALASDLYAGPVARLDLGNAAIVDLAAGTLASVTDLALLGGANALGLESAPGLWEVLQVRPRRAHRARTLSAHRLLRGQRGTEDAIGNPASAGARVVVLDEAVVALPMGEAELGLPFTWRIGPASRPVSDSAYAEASFTVSGRGLRPFSVAHVEQPWRRAREKGDLLIHWTRRSRALAADGWGAPEVPLAEEAESYEVEILDPGSGPGQASPTVKRTLGTPTTSVTYSAADQLTDWGVLLGPGQVLAIRIYQLSALYGRGAPKSATLTF